MVFPSTQDDYMEFMLRSIKCTTVFACQRGYMLNKLQNI